MTDPGELYAAALRGEAAVVARLEDGSSRPVDVDLWTRRATACDERVLRRARGPVLDVGCGPGRHVHALARQGVLAVGVDVTLAAVTIARERGVEVMHASVFDHLPGAGSWQTALLLDGNIGIGGAPATLLARLAQILRPDGRILVELEPPGTGVVAGRLRLEGAGLTSEPFPWARVAADAIDEPAARAGFDVAERWEDDARWFAMLSSR